MAQPSKYSLSPLQESAQLIQSGDRKHTRSLVDWRTANIMSDNFKTSVVYRVTHQINAARFSRRFHNELKPSVELTESEMGATAVGENFNLDR